MKICYFIFLCCWKNNNVLTNNEENSVMATLSFQSGVAVTSAYLLLSVPRRIKKMSLLSAQREKLITFLEAQFYR